MLRKAALSIINKCARRLGAEESVIIGRGASMPRWDERILHAKKLGFAVSSCLDVGAYVGTWSRLISEIFPDCKIIAIEPNPYIYDDLVRSLSTLSSPSIVLPIAVAEQSGQSEFNIWGNPHKATSASLQDHVRGDAEIRITVDIDTLDNIVAKYNFQPELVKLDLQGAEIKALRGASYLLKTVEMFLVEFGCLNAYIDRATPRQLLDIFYDNDYCLYDIVECHYRPYDGALTGGDFIFVKNSSQLRSYKNWD